MCDIENNQYKDIENQINIKIYKLR